MKLDTLGEIFVTRRLYLSDDERKHEILVKVGKPQGFPDSRDFYCPYQIVGLGDEKIRYAGGIDEIQALQLSLEKIGSDLYTSQQGKSGKLRWQGDECGDLGFPVPASIKDLVPRR